MTEEITIRQTANETASAVPAGQASTEAPTVGASVSRRTEREETTNRKPTVSWAALLDEAVSKPGFIHQAYSRFHNYSLGNQLLALFQCFEREITPGPLASFMKWKQLGRRVKKGERALTLCMPLTCTRTKTVKKDDGSEQDEQFTFTHFTYKNNWFVLSQTEGKDYQPPAIPEWNEEKTLAALKIGRIPFENLDGNTQGYARRGGKIAINPLAALPFKTLCHEPAHSTLHCAEGDMADTDQTPRSVAEVEAEAVALLCCESLGLPGAEFSRGYIQAWVLSQLNLAGKKGAIEFPSAARLQAWVEEHVYLSLQGAPFKKDDAALLPEAGACTGCPKRTGFNPSLFPEVKKHDSCLDRECFQKKLNAFVQIKFAEAPAGSVKIRTSWQFAGKEAPKDVLTRDQYHESRKGACEHTVQAIVAQGENIGAAQWVCVSKDGKCPVHGVSSQYVGESPQAKAARLEREAEARLELKRRRATFEAIREKARKARSLDLADYRLITSEFFARLHFDTAKQFVVLNGYVTPAMAKQRKVEPSGPSGNNNGNDYATYFQNLVAKANLKQLGAWLLELALIQHRDHAPYSYASDKTVRDPLFETARRWGADAKAVGSAVETKSKPAQKKQTTKPTATKKSKKN